MVDNSATEWKEGDGNLIWSDNPFWHVNKETCISIFNQALENPVIDIWCWGSHLSQFLGTFASLSDLGFRLSNLLSRLGCLGSDRRLTENSATTYPCSLPLSSGLGLQTWILMFSILGKMQTLLSAFMSCCIWASLINPALDFIAVSYQSRRKGDIKIGSLSRGTTNRNNNKAETWYLGAPCKLLSCRLC